MATTMKKTFLDKLREKVNGWYRKNPSLRPLYKAFVVVVLFFYHIVMHFASNGKKYLCGVVVLALFLANTSFTYYGNGEIIQTEAANNSDIALVTEQDITTSALSPEEVDATGFGSGDYQTDDSEDSFTLEDIWEEHAAYLENTEEHMPVTDKYENVTFDNHRPHIARVQVFPALSQCVVGASSRPESVARLRKFRFEDGCQGLRDCLLDDPVYCCWDPQLPCLSVVLGYLYPAYRLGLVFPRQDGFPDIFAFVFEILQKFIHLHPIDAACAFVSLHPLVRTVQIVGAYDLLQ